MEPLRLQVGPAELSALQVFCNGEEVLTVSGTKEKYVVDVWSGNHPFFRVYPTFYSAQQTLDVFLASGHGMAAQY